MTEPQLPHKFRKARHRRSTWGWGEGSPRGDPSPQAEPKPWIPVRTHSPAPLPTLRDQDRKNAGVNLRFKCKEKLCGSLHSNATWPVKCQSKVAAGFTCRRTWPIAPRKPLPLGGDRLAWASRPCPKPSLHYLHGLELELSLCSIPLGQNPKAEGKN